RPNTSSYPMMNQDGKLIDYSGQPLNVAGMSEMKLVPAADKPYQAPAKPLSKEEALQLAKAAAGRTDEPNNANYNEQGAEQKSRIWNFNWQSQDDKGGIYTNVGVDVDRGLIVNYNSYGPQQPLKEGEQPKFTETQARAVAIEFIRSYRPDLSGKIMIMPSVESSNPAMKAKLAQQQTYFVTFVMMKNGLRVADHQLSVNVDNMTGKVSSFWANDLDSKQAFPAATGVIKPEAAMDAFLTSQGLEAGWAQFYLPGPSKQMQQSEPQLVWGPGTALNVVAIDAKTGAPLDYQGRDLLQQGKRPTDIDGQPAEREIELLWARGILDLKDGKFNPGQTATAGELARWLVMARGMQPYMSYDFRGNFAGSAAPAAAKLESAADSAYFGAALQNGVILPEDFTADSDPAAPVSRELFALWVARAMGYGAVAKMPNHIAMPFADQSKIGAKYANAVALLNGLGVAKGDQQTNFEPQGQVTRGEAAMFLFTVASEPRR
ncbi:MAG: Propeptide PepSY amd peptidase, partial [Firmicutes bacterium]|nr:Propeptide PepSY amd peptidase [Bacillota bacterium]